MPELTKLLSQQNNVTIAQVAKEAKVSISSVSRFMNRSAQLSKAKSDRIEAVITKLNYSPSPVAQSLVRGSTKTIGVLTQFIDSPFFGEALRGIEQTFLQANYTPLVVSGGAVREREIRQLKTLIDRKVDAIIVLSGNLKDADIKAVAKLLPVVVMGRRLDAQNINSIFLDNQTGVGLAVEHLSQLYHKTIAYLSGPMDNHDAVDRLRGFREQMRQRGLSVNEDLIVYGDFQENGGYQATLHLLAKRIPFTAVISANDQMAYGALLALRSSAFRVPDDVSLVGFDDLPHSSYASPPLTTVKDQVLQIGEYAARLTLARLQGTSLPNQDFTPSLMVRESTRRNLA